MIGYRTYIVAAIISVLGVLQGVDWMRLVSDPKTFGWSLLGTGLAMAVMRSITATEPGKSK